MTRAIHGSVSHAGPDRPSLLSRLADRFRGHHDLPQVPADLQDHGDGMNLPDDRDIVDALAAEFEQRHGTPAPWETAQRPDGPDGAWPGFRSETLTDARTPDGRPYTNAALASRDRMTPRYASVEADLGGLVLFRDTVRAELVRRARPRPQGCWPDQYARLWHEQAEGLRAASRAPLPDFALHRWDGLVSDIMAHAGAVADAEWAEARAAAAVCEEYAGRHTAGSEAAA